jgi:hypothetical protein
MSGEHPELDDLQAVYRTALETWIASIKKEEALASMNHSMIEIDEWEKALEFKDKACREFAVGGLASVTKELIRKAREKAKGPAS